MRVLLFIIFGMMLYLAVQQYRMEKNCVQWTEETVMSYNPALKMIRPKKINVCVKDKQDEENS